MAAAMPWCNCVAASNSFFFLSPPKLALRAAALCLCFSAVGRRGIPLLLFSKVSLCQVREGYAVSPKGNRRKLCRGSGLLIGLQLANFVRAAVEVGVGQCRTDFCRIFIFILSLTSSTDLKGLPKQGVSQRSSSLLTPQNKNKYKAKLLHFPVPFSIDLTWFDLFPPPLLPSHSNPPCPLNSSHSSLGEL